MSEMNFSEDLIKNVINDPKTQELMKESIQKSITKAIEDSFRSYGDLNKAIENKIKEVLVPYIENYDITKHIPKLDTLLTEIVNSTTLMDNKTILKNFKELMIEPESKTITLEAIFQKYCKYMADDIDTTNLEVSTDDGPHYESFECYCEVEETSSQWSHYERYDVIFRCDESVDNDENKIFHIELRRWKDDIKSEYGISFSRDIKIDSLKYLNDFEVFLLKLVRSGVKVTNIQDYAEDVEPTAEPEASWS